MQLSRGILIAVEGIDGSGKSSLVTSLARSLQEQQIAHITTKEPGGSQLGKHLRALLHDRPVAITPKAEYLLFAADRSQHFAEVIEPALAQKMVVISDRLADSSLVYQGYGRNLNIETMRTINAWAMNNRTPDLTIYLHIDVDTALARITKRGESLTAFEQEKRPFFENLVTGYTELYKNRTDVLILDGAQAPGVLTQEAYIALTKFINSL